MDQRSTCGVLGKYNPHLHHLHSMIHSQYNLPSQSPLHNHTKTLCHDREFLYLHFFFYRCILIELITNNYLFAGANDEEQLDLIFRVFGTPSDNSWPGVTQLPGWTGMEKKKKPKYPPQDLNDVFGLYVPLLPSSSDLLLTFLTSIQY